MPEQPLVSILIPTYQRAHRLISCLQSILTQTYKNIEVVIVDNASTDATAQVIQPFLADPRIRFFQNSENIGSPRNHNRCIEESKGEYLKFLHSDDRFTHDKVLEQWVDYMIRYPTCKMVTCGSVFPTLNSVRQQPFDLLRSAGFHSVRQSLRFQAFGLQSDWMFKKSLLNQTGLLADSFSCDCDFLMKAAYVTDILTVKEVWIEHEYGADNETMVADRLRAWEALRLMLFTQLPYYTKLSVLQKVTLSSFLHSGTLSRMLPAVRSEDYSDLLLGFSDLLYLDPALDLFPGEQRRQLLEELIRLIVQRRPRQEIYDFVATQKWSKPYAHHFLYGFSFSYELYHLTTSLEQGSRRLILVGAQRESACLYEAFPELEPYISADLPELVLGNAPPDREEQMALLSDGTEIQRDHDIILIGENPSGKILNAQLTSRGWKQGLDFIPIQEYGLR
ncbi:hypothetical protein PA598K_00463 [Paenibacillus sp. 598K]|uniref:glycosyltransferase family 2 protein n=1 Tax=Paenibacillus sp. 598K TaxID=1117987 RepID=UPI000FFA6422|nr:glycosyltransferase family A protein [Paenibacillus sp. 598K]GBF72225.1 hypothetical protein PA598K_00463 [Paenibacillus sp. 598K]